ncbi:MULTISPECIES: DUF998 domain-containing protein [Actinosynnema]|uniref:DUF998 domain-containing protein n=1 Tax=Actinosynnema TaxID=40566 RepID=UPI0020A579B4|nr:DUF998 domain-containing protein [Actinosynnema pretiosum]MCP2097135.1 Protein of unknown function (DUF998) [Actinosynnema pretiosum]
MVVHRALLWCGAAGSALFLALLLLDDAVKPDYDPLRDAVSEAALGAGGWVQTTNFLLSGLLIAVSAPAVASRVGRWTGALVALVGAGLALAGAFPTDPVPTDAPTWQGAVHNTAGTLSSVALIIACFTAARWRPTPRWRRCSLAVGAAVPLAFAVGALSPDTFGLWQRLTNALGWTWLIVLALRADRQP